MPAAAGQGEAARPHGEEQAEAECPQRSWPATAEGPEGGGAKGEAEEEDAPEETAGTGGR